MSRPPLSARYDAGKQHAVPDAGMPCPHTGCARRLPRSPLAAGQFCPPAPDATAAAPAASSPRDPFSENKKGSLSRRKGCPLAMVQTYV